MIDLLYSVPAHPMQPHPIRLNREFRSDLAWWRTFIVSWNRVSILPPPRHLPAMEMASDASGSWGCGVWQGARWFQLKCDEAALALPIVVKELLPIVLAASLWDSRLVICHCDNQAVVACLWSRTSKNRHCMHMLRVLAFIEARHCFHLRPVYINTKLNHLADDLTRDNLSSFLVKVPQAHKRSDPLPLPQLNLLMDREADWVQPSWHHLFTDIFRLDSRNQPRSPTALQ